MDMTSIGRQETKRREISVRLGRTPAAAAWGCRSLYYSGSWQCNFCPAFLLDGFKFAQTVEWHIRFPPGIPADYTPMDQLR